MEDQSIFKIFRIFGLNKIILNLIPLQKITSQKGHQFTLNKILNK
jgi:hypothetical protein